MSNSKDTFDRAAIRSFFRGDWNDEPARSRTDRRMLAEAAEDHKLPALESYQVSRLADAIVTGLIDQFDINMPKGKDGKKSDEEKELLAQITYHVEKYTELPAIIYELAMDTQVELGGDWEYDQAGNRVNVDDADDDDPWEDYDFGPDAPERAEMVDIVAGAVWDAITDGGWTGEFNRAELDDLVDNMIAAADLDKEAWHQANIDFEEINDRVNEFKDDYQDELSGGGLK